MHRNSVLDYLTLGQKFYRNSVKIIHIPEYPRFAIHIYQSARVSQTRRVRHKFWNDDVLYCQHENENLLTAHARSRSVRTIYRAIMLVSVHFNLLWQMHLFIRSFVDSGVFPYFSSFITECLFAKTQSFSGLNCRSYCGELLFFNKIYHLTEICKFDFASI